MKIIKNIIVKLNVINILSLFCHLFSLCRIKNKKIFCTNFSGKGYGDNPKYIIEELIKKDKNLDIVWAVNNNNYKFPSYVRTVKIYSIKYFYELMTSKIWINNSRFEQFIRKRKNQYYVQTWHGNLGMKKIEYDAYDKLSEHYKKVMKNDNKMIDLFLSNSDFSDDLFRRSFKYDGEILKYGTPRNDILINADYKIYNKKIKDFYNISESKKILLYAPTFRNEYKVNPYDIDFDQVIKDLKKITNSEWIVIIKLHPRIKKTSSFIKNYDKYYDALKYDDIQELIMACDMLITDYSSTMMEAMIANKPVIIYAKDADSYINERGFCLTFDDMPFLVSKNNSELNNIIKKSDKNFNNLLKKYDNFKTKINLCETGKSSYEVSKRILERVKNEK